MTDFEARIDIRSIDAASTIDISSAPRVVPLVDVSEIFGRPRSAYEKYAKPVIDRCGAMLLIILTLPLLSAAALAVWISMGSPVILRQERVGHWGKVFTVYKFRTMEPDRRVEQAAFVGQDRRLNHKDPTDPRITRVGRFLREWSLDELPQFFNVLKGDMSLVGPRPELVNIVARYEPWQHRRHAVKPGITGPWQVSERGNRLLHECTESDISYLEELTWWSDLKILALTPLAAFGIRRGH